MLSDKEKLKSLRASQNLSQGNLAKALDVSKSLIIAIENGDRNISMKLLKKIEEVYKVDLYNSNTAEDLKITDNIIPIPIHDISAAAGAGTWLGDEPPTDVMYFDKRFLKQILKRDTYDTIHIIHAEGDSMDSGWNQPDDIKDGDLLMVDTSQTTGNNQIFVILVDNQKLRVKKLSKQGDTLYVTSNNPAYKEEVYRPDSSESEIRVIGKVVWNGNKESA
jgi:phage repressor protein C with HTH and peptisase S24 domain